MFTYSVKLIIKLKIFCKNVIYKCQLSIIRLGDNKMNVKDFDFYLPEELIAQHPLEKRDTSRLMVLD